MKKLKWLNVSCVFNKIKHSLCAFKVKPLYSYVKKALNHKFTFSLSCRNAPDSNKTLTDTKLIWNLDPKKLHKIIRYSTGFSMMELLFVLVIIGILASLALPRISFSRNNALSVAIQSDIQTIISSTQEYAITNEFMPQNANPQWLVSYLRLSPQRWVVSGDSLKLAKNGVPDSQNDCLSIRFNQTTALEILFNRSQNSNLCQNLLKNYASDIIIPLHITP
ncbi:MULTISPECIES: type II secretion system protein [Helicobacter]|uniref:Prepilin-type N-terminal cleavage/methylation domain-containing protein n=1 Tax=Helicobacter bilis ATCC 43879 TaxID=613026 RepID=C3XDF4_9HELI|nr:MULTISPECIES: prepilin-type N-terminal cleavage/methylation domain-containing protein [Helicobacter]EEO23043.2 prepilin-type N-terminal cleavage/methylation domain-containing protein [Helicobacter bilis ATCC 43879]